MTTKGGYKINPKEWRKMTEDQKLLEIMSAFILEHTDIVDDGTLEGSLMIEESELARDILHIEKKERDEAEAEYEAERKRVNEVGGN